MHGDGIRSLLFAPGDNDKLIGKALSSPADAVILDLEDAVPPERKDMARQMVADALTNVPRAHRSVFVRVNAFDTGSVADDLAIVMRGAPWGIVLPKCHGPTDLAKLDCYLDALEAREDIERGSTKILAIVTETAAATLGLGQWQGFSSPRLWGVMWGSEDLAASLGATGNRNADGRYTFPYQAARSNSLYLAKALGVAAVDAVWTDIRDTEGLEGEAIEGRRDGFSVKAAIHPGQLETINRIFSPTETQIQWAEKVVQILDDRAIAQLDGRMIDLAHKRIAEGLIRRSKALGSQAS